MTEMIKYYLVSAAIINHGPKYKNLGKEVPNNEYKKYCKEKKLNGTI